MAEPQESITTVSGRRCTRSRRSNPPATSSVSTTIAAESTSISTSTTADPTSAVEPTSQAAVSSQNNEPAPQPAPTSAAQQDPAPPQPSTDPPPQPQPQPPANNDPAPAPTTDPAPPANEATSAQAAPVATNAPIQGPAPSEGPPLNAGTQDNQSPTSQSQAPENPPTSARAAAPEPTAVVVAPAPAPTVAEAPPVTVAGAPATTVEIPAVSSSVVVVNVVPSEVSTVSNAATSGPVVSEIAQSPSSPAPQLSNAPATALPALGAVAGPPGPISQANVAPSLSSIADRPLSATSISQPRARPSDATAAPSANQPVQSGGSFAPTGVPGSGFNPPQGDSRSDVTPAQNTTAIVAGVIGGVVAIALIAGVIWLFRRRKRRNEASPREKRYSNRQDQLPSRPTSIFARAKDDIANAAHFIILSAGSALGKARSRMVPSRADSRSEVQEGSQRSRSPSTPTRDPANHRRSTSAPAEGLRGKFTGLMSGVTDRFGRRVTEPSIPSPPRSPFPENTPSAPSNPFLDPPNLNRLTITNPDPTTPPNENPPQIPYPLPTARPRSQRRNASHSSIPAEQNPFSDPSWTTISSRPTRLSRASTATALHSHPPSMSMYSTPSRNPSQSRSRSRSGSRPRDLSFFNPFADPTNPYGSSLTSKEIARASVHILPDSARTSRSSSSSSQKRHPAANPLVNTNSFYFGSPGPSRRTTGYDLDGRAFKGKSDPFDLDRPEILALGTAERSVVGEVERREVRISTNGEQQRRGPGWEPSRASFVGIAK